MKINNKNTNSQHLGSEVSEKFLRFYSTKNIGCGNWYEIRIFSPL